MGGERNWREFGRTFGEEDYENYKTLEGENVIFQKLKSVIGEF